MLLCLLPVLCCAQENELLQDAMNEAIEAIDFTQIQGFDLFGFPEGTDVRDAVQLLASGESSLQSEDILERMFMAFMDEASKLGSLMLALMLPVLLSSLLFHTLCGAGEALAGLTRSVCFVMILTPVMLLVFAELEHTRETITVLTNRMDRMLPLLLTMLTALGGSASSALLHPLVVAASGSMVFLAREVVLRLVMCTCAVTAVNHLSDRAHLTRMAQLLRSAVCWFLGVSFTVFLSAMSLQGVCSASIDGVAIRAAKYAVDNFVPVVGGMFSDTMDTLVGCTLIVKNALGVAAVLVLLAVVARPLMRTLAVIFVMKLSAALLEPVADHEIVQAIGDFSHTIMLFFITMMCVCTMYFLLIVQMLLVGNLTVMLR